MRYFIHKKLCKKSCLKEIRLGIAPLILKYAACAHFQNRFIKEHEMGKNTRVSLTQKESQVKLVENLYTREQDGGYKHFWIG